MPKSVDYGELCDMHLEACAGGHPKDHLVWVDWTDTEHASDNKYLIANSIETVMGRSINECETFSSYLAKRPLHEDETTTQSGSYRKAIDGSTLDMGAAMRSRGRDAAAQRFLSRTRASMAHLLFGYGPDLPRELIDQGVPGVPSVLIGSGQRKPLRGDPQGKTKYIVGVGQRSHVRARMDDVVGGSHFHGHFEYTEAEELRVMLAQLLGHPYEAKVYKYEHAVYNWAFAHGVPYWGLSPEERGVAIRFAMNPLDISLAQQVALFAAECLPALHIRYDRYQDGSVFAIAFTLKQSSTGGLAVAGQYADGRTVRMSADDGGRAKGSVKPQIAWDDSTHYYCQYRDGGPILKVRKPDSPLAYSVDVVPNEGVHVVRRGGSIVTPTPTPAPAPAPAPQPHPASDFHVIAELLDPQWYQAVAAEVGFQIGPGTLIVTPSQPAQVGTLHDGRIIIAAKP